MTLAEQTAAKLESMGVVVDGAHQDSHFKGMFCVTVAAGRIVESVEAAREEGFDMISDIFGVDYLHYPRHRGKRFAVVYNLFSVPKGDRIFIRTEVEDGDTLPTITHLWPAANFMEREVYEMFGVVFEGHPDLRRLITPEDLPGHPHRKDFPIGETPTLFNDGRFLDPAAFRAGLTGKQQGLTGWKGGARKGVRSRE